MFMFLQRQRGHDHGQRKRDYQAREIADAEQQILESCRQAALPVNPAHGDKQIDRDVNHQDRGRDRRNPLGGMEAVNNKAGSHQQSQREEEKRVVVDEKQKMLDVVAFR